MKKHHAIGALAAIIAAILLFSAIAFGQGSQFDFLLNQQRNASASLAGGTATFYEAGSMTPKAIYSDIGLMTLALNPYTLNSSGKAQLYGSGLYKIVVKNSAGVTQYTYDNVAVNSLGGYVASQTPTSGEIPVLGANREFKIRNGGSTRTAILDRGVSGVSMGTLDYNQTVLAGRAGAFVSAGFDPFGVAANATNGAYHQFLTDGSIVSRTTTSAGAAFSTYSAWTPGSGANKVNGFTATPTPTINKIPVADQSGGRLAWGWKPAFRGAYAYSSVGTSVADSTETAISMGSELYDTDSIHSTSADTSRLTVPSGITYVRLNGNALFGADATGYRSVTIHKNGTSYEGYSMTIVPAIAGVDMQINISTPIIACSPGDYYELSVKHTAGAPVTVFGKLAMELIQ